MDSTEFEKVLKRQRLVSQEAHSTIDKLLSHMNHVKSELAQGVVPKSELVKMKDWANKVVESHKDFQSTLHKYTKNVDKKFKMDLNSVWDPNAFCDKKHVLNQALATHFIREGLFELEGTFEDESNIFLPDAFKEQFNEMFAIKESMKLGNLQLAIDWSKKHTMELSKMDSSLEFQLHRICYIQFLLKKDTQGALKYAKANFSCFAHRHMAEIQRLMCAILFSSRLSFSPYSDLLASHLLQDVQSLFTRDFCCLLGLAPSSPLFVACMVGTTALPTIIKMSSVLKGGMAMEWQSRGELPVEIPLLDKQRYHSVFTCPVSKEQSTEENPPMMLLCGHVICKEPLNRLGKANLNAKFKCPYCPQDSTIAQCQRIYF